MRSRRSVNSDSVKVSNPVIVLFICVGIILVTVPLIVSCTILVRKYLRRNCSNAQPQGCQLRQLRLRSVPPVNNTILTDPAVSAAVDQVSSANPPAVSSRVKSKSPKISSRLSRPIHLPVRLSTLQPRKSKPETASKPHNSPPKSMSEASLISSMTDVENTKRTISSPVSSLSSVELDIDKPRPTYQPPRHAQSRNPSRRSEIMFDQDLFLESLAQCGRDVKYTGRTPYSEATKMEAGTSSSNDNGSRTANMEHDRGQGEEGEWREARMETVDGVLAPREWV